MEIHVNICISQSNKSNFKKKKKKGAYTLEQTVGSSSNLHRLCVLKYTTFRIIFLSISSEGNRREAQ